MRYSDFLELEPHEIFKKWTAEIDARREFYKKWLLPSGTAISLLAFLVFSVLYHFHFFEQAQIHLISLSLGGGVILMLYLLLQLLLILEVWIVRMMVK